MNILIKTKLTEKNGRVFLSDRTGKVQLRDGRTGEEFDNPVTIGFMHYYETASSG